MLKIGTVVLGVADVRRAADFWTQALHYVPREGKVEDDWTTYPYQAFNQRACHQPQTTNA